MAQESMGLWLDVLCGHVRCAMSRSGCAERPLREGSNVLIGELTNSGAIPTLELMARFAGARQRIIASNIANLETPDYQPQDVSPQAFQRALGKAVDARRAASGSEGPLLFSGTDQVQVGCDGSLALTPGTPSGNILAHDRNNRDIEGLMAQQAENVAVFRTTIELLRSRYGVMQAAIAERV
jgi:flagellar basal-body rod protein FlgB